MRDVREWRQMRDATRHDPDLSSGASSCHPARLPRSPDRKFARLAGGMLWPAAG
jgi:hypothetical protein